MTEINKQAFVSELAKFLSFMRDEDREALLDMYNALFDEVVDTRKLLSLLVSPTRQAVLIARAYDSAPTAGGEMPKFLKVVEDIRTTAINEGLMDTAEKVEEAAPASELPKEDAEEEEDNSIPVLENQVSIFDEAETEKKESDAPAFVFETENADAVSEQSEEPSAKTAAEDVDALFYAREEAEAAPEEEKPAELIKSEKEINAFIADFEREAEAVINGGSAEPKSIEDEAEAVMAAAVEEAAAESGPAEAKTVSKARVPLLILYCLFAIPVTLVVLTVLLVPALALFGCAVAVSVAGAYVMSAVFSGFAVLADILVVLGCALIVLAIALFFVWAFIWFVACVMVGFVRAVVNLGRKWCFKEVPVA